MPREPALLSDVLCGGLKGRSGGDTRGKNPAAGRPEVGVAFQEALIALHIFYGVALFVSDYQGCERGAPRKAHAHDICELSEQSVIISVSTLSALTVD